MKHHSFSVSQEQMEDTGTYKLDENINIEEKINQQSLILETNYFSLNNFPSPE